MNAVSKVPDLIVRRKVAAEADELFDAWLDPAKLSGWMRPGDAKRATVHLDPRVGGKLEVVMHLPKGKVPHTGAYELIERPRRLVFTWNSPEAGRNDSRVTLEFEPVDGGTEVVLTHEGLPSADEVEAHRKGWSRILELMAGSYETLRAAG